MKKATWLIFLLLAFIFAYFYHDPWWNGNSRLGLTYALVQEGRLEIDSFHDQGAIPTGDKAFYNGHYYTDKAIGASLAAVIFYFPIYHLQQILNITFPTDIVKYLLTFLTIGLPSALAGSLLFRMSYRLSGDLFRSFVAALAVCLGTMFFPFSVTFFGHQLASAFLFSAFYVIYRLKNGGGKPGSGHYFRAGLLPGMALITEYTTAPIALILAVYFIHSIKGDTLRQPWRSLALPALGAAIPLALFMAYNMAVYGSPFTIGYAFEADPVFQAGQAQGFMGIGWPSMQVVYYILIHPAIGLFWQSPVLIFAVAGLVIMLRRKESRPEALAAVSSFLALVLINSGHYMWWGGDSFGPRHLIPALPFLGLTLAFIPGKWFAGVVAAGLVSILQMLIGVASRMLFTPEEPLSRIASSGFFSYSAIYDFSLNQLLNGEFSANFGSKVLGLRGWVSLALPLAAILLAPVAAWHWQKSTPPQPRRAQIM